MSVDRSKGAWENVEAVDIYGVLVVISTVVKYGKPKLQYNELLYTALQLEVSFITCVK